MTGESTQPRAIPRRWFHRRPVTALLVVNLISFTLAGCAFELVFRYQLVDFYGIELRALNRANEAAIGLCPTILVLGDSFSAGVDSYPNLIRGSGAPRWRVINSAVPGTTIGHAMRMAPGRLSRFRPQLVIYQTYVGNDLLDLNHPVNWRRVQPFRNLYWLLLDGGATSLGFLNYRLGQLKNRVVIEWWSPHRSSPEHLAAIRERPFSVAEYRRRERMLLAADPQVFHRQIALDGDMAEAWTRYSAQLEGLADQCEFAGARLVVLPIPHCTQVHDRYRDRFTFLGAVFPQPELLEASDYPFLAGIRETAMRRSSTTVVDPLPALRHFEARDRVLYFNNDAHLNERGQEVLATELRRQLGLAAPHSENGAPL